MAVFRNFLLETFVLYLASHIIPCLQIMGKTQTVIFLISGQSFINKNCHDSNNGIGMKLGPATRFNKRNKKNWSWCHVSKLWHYCHLSDLFPIWSYVEPRFQTYKLKTELNDLKHSSPGLYPSTFTDLHLDKGVSFMTVGHCISMLTLAAWGSSPQVFK